MAISSSLSTIQKISSTPPLFQASPPLSNPPLLHRINWAFGFYVAYLTAGVSYCLYNLYQAYQFSHHTSFGLDNRFKLAKCQALFDEAKEKDFENAKPLLQQCEALLASITADSSSDKRRFLMKIAKYYAECNPERSYQMALSFSSSDELFTIAQSIYKKHPDFNADKLNTLFSRAYEAQNQEEKDPNRSRILFTNLREMLELVKVFHSLKNDTLSNQCMTKALELAKAETKDLDQSTAFCQIARCYQEIGNPEMRSSIELARALLNDKVVGVHIIGARLNLAHTFFSFEDFSNMDQVLKEAMSLIEKDDPLTTLKNLYSLAKLTTEIRKSEKAKSTFKNFEVEPLIQKAFTALQENKLNSLSAEARASGYLEIASIYQGLLNHSVEGSKALDAAFQEIQKLPEDTDEAINAKIDLLMQLSHFYEKDANTMGKIIQSLENLYDRCPVEFDSTSGLEEEKPGFGKEILRLYNKAGLTEQSDVFFQKYLSDLQTSQRDKDIFNKINRLVTYAHRYVGDYQNVGQIRAQLEAAEALLPQVTSSISYKYALSMIIQGYLEIDRQKGLTLLENYENQQAKNCLITAIAIPILMGIAYVYPEAGSLLSLGVSALSLWQGGFI